MVKKQKWTLSGILLLIIVAGVQFLPQFNQPQSEVSQEVQQQSAKYHINEVDLSDPPRFEKIEVNAIRNVDGDTFAFTANGKEYKLRLLMVDTPESVKKGVAVQPYGKEASNYTKQELSKGNVSLVFDKGEPKDRYDRFLAYVYVDDQLLQDKLLSEGLAIVRYVNSGGDSYLDELLAAQRKAQEQKLGVWSVSDYVTETHAGYYQYNQR